LYLPSAYTNSGKYVGYYRIDKNKIVIRKYNLKCRIPSKRKTGQ